MSMTRLQSLQRMKRLFDIAGAVAGVVFFSPVMVVVAAAVLMDDGRPVLFPQERVGYRRRPFVIWKFRTMRDGQVTRTGRVLRASGLDEVAQFFNILKGDMSAVGPRPLTDADVQRLGWARAAYARRSRSNDCKPPFATNAACAFACRVSLCAFVAPRRTSRSGCALHASDHCCRGCTVMTRTMKACISCM